MNDDQLRALLTDAVSDVQPTRDLEVPPARPRVHWLPVTVAAALATVLVVTGTAWLVRDGATSGATATPRASVVVWDVVTTPGGFRLASDRRTVSTDDPLLAAVKATVDDVVGDLDVYVSVSNRREAVTVDLAVGEADTFEMDLGSPPDLLPQAIAWTVASATGSREPVRLSWAGSPEPRWLDSARPAVPDPSVLAPVTVDSVGDGETVSSPFTVSGLAATFEGTVTWKLVADEQTVREGFTTAQECCTASPYSFDVEAPPGDYELQVSETDPGDGEGYPPYTDSRRVVVE